MRTANVIVVEQRIAAPPEIVFTYFTDPQRHLEWQGLECDLDPRPRGVYRVRLSGDTWISGEYLEVVPPRRIVLTWGWETDDPSAIVRESRRLFPDVPEASIDAAAASIARSPGSIGPGSTIVEIDFVEDAGATLVRVRHSGFETPRAGELHGFGWRLVLDRLLAVTEGRDPGPYPFGAGPAT